MALLKIFVWIILGLFFLFVVAPICYLLLLYLIYSIKARWAVRLIKKHPEFSKLYDYANALGINVLVVDIEDTWATGIVAFTQQKIIWANSRDILNLRYRDFGLAAFAHEIAHIKHGNRCGESFCRNWYRETGIDHGCLWEEWLAWIEGWNIIQATGVKLDEKRYWRIAKDCINTYYTEPCLGYRNNSCPKKEAIDKLAEKMESKIAKLDKN